MTEVLDTKERNYTKRYEFVLRAVGLDTEPIRGKKIVDVGCKEGFFLEGLLANGADAYGLDIDISHAPESLTRSGKGESVSRIRKHDYLKPFPRDLKGSNIAVAFTTPEINEIESVLRDKEPQAESVWEKLKTQLANMLEIADEARVGPFVFPHGDSNPLLLRSMPNIIVFSRDKGLSFRFITTGPVLTAYKGKQILIDMITLVIHKPEK